MIEKSDEPAAIIFSVAVGDVREPQVVLEAATVKEYVPGVAPVTAIVTYAYTVPPLGTVIETELKVAIPPVGVVGLKTTPEKYT